MSLKSLTSIHEVDIQRLTATTASDMGTVEAYSTVRAKAKCRVQPASAKTITEFAKRGISITHSVFFSYDPEVDERYRLKYGSRMLRVHAAYDMNELGRCWEVHCEEKSTDGDD